MEEFHCHIRADRFSVENNLKFELNNSHLSFWSVVDSSCVFLELGQCFYFLSVIDEAWLGG